MPLDLIRREQMNINLIIYPSITFKCRFRRAHSSPISRNSKNKINPYIIYLEDIFVDKENRDRQTDRQTNKQMRAADLIKRREKTERQSKSATVMREK